MCGCGCAKTEEASSDPAPEGAEIVRVEDLSCGHCVATITEAIRAKWPEAKVKADLASKTVSVVGLVAGSDVRGVIRGAGYTPAG